MSDADEIRAGELLAHQFVVKEGMKPSPQSQKIDTYLQTVGDRVASHAQRKLPYRFRFDPNPTFKSAVGLPGGEIFVGAGILAYMDSEDQLAAVLGHEIEHVALNHTRDRLIKTLSTQHPSTKELKQLKIADFLPGYGYDNEFSADREGVKLAAQAGYSIDGAIRLLQTFVLLGEQTPNTPAEAASAIEERIAQIRSLEEASKTQPTERPLGLP
jgi:beta-barrel assembly-enhancing protease